MKGRKGVITSIAAVPTSAGKRARSLALAAAAAALLAGCGSGDEATIPQSDADELLSYLSAVEENVESADCEFAVQQAENFKNGVEALPASVGVEVKDGLREAGSNLEQLASSECTTAGATGPQDAEPTEEATTTEEEPVEGETTTTTTEEATTTEEPEPAPEESQTVEPGNSENGPPGPVGNPNLDVPEGNSGGIAPDKGKPGQ